MFHFQVKKVLSKATVLNTKARVLTYFYSPVEYESTRLTHFYSPLEYESTRLTYFCSAVEYESTPLR